LAQIDSLFKQLMESNGSDLHLMEGQKPKIRIHGTLQEVSNKEQLKAKDMESLLQEITDQNSWNRFKTHNDLDFAYTFGDKARFRVNYYRHFYGYGAIFRIIPSNIQSLDELEMPDVLKKFNQLRSGLILITGPTGSGKSTTLAAIINHINETTSKKIITIEEPIEFLHQNKSCIISHREVGHDTQSFASGLKGAIKSDTDIILVGEMRDQETIALALTAAKMGIVVFGTLHTNSASKTIDRIIDVFPSNKKNQVRSLLSSTLQGVVAQQLIKSVDGNKRWAAYEILLKTTSLSALIRTGESEKIISEIQLNSAIGMIPMDDCLNNLVNEGKISKEEAHLKALDKLRFSN